MTTKCLCMTCAPTAAGIAGETWRYACERCGNKRCPHHEDHRFACTGSNESGQLGVVDATPPAKGDA